MNSIECLNFNVNKEKVDVNVSIEKKNNEVNMDIGWEKNTDQGSNVNSTNNLKDEPENEIRDRVETNEILESLLTKSENASN